MTKTLYAEFTVKPGAEERVAQMMRGLTVYRDEAAFQEHIAADYGREFNRELVDLIEEDGSQLSWLEPLPAVPVA
ncbi:hypothetical protein [Sinomonas mesophila]|uniref:hypothetical protein n=1 Tax=Sinomonas mesophila TaxID=1531955 RepID=UPI00098441E6|nr:hypothetical protein [Sinomonas mesophila]